MELPHVGKRCNNPQCKQLDFLPLVCKCGQLYCAEHFRKHVAECPECPKDREVDELRKIEGVHTCSRDGCKETSIVPMICEKCGQHFCVIHRHVTECFKEDPSVRAQAIEKMAIPVRQFQEAKSVVDKQIDANISNQKKKKKNTEMAEKLQLMRVKNKATGLKSIPSTDRVYFNVRFPKKCGDRASPVFIAKTWTVGRAIDAIADELKVPNKNNVGGELKLRLFHTETGAIIVDCVSSVVSSLLIARDLIDGESLSLEYVADNCKSINHL